MSSQNSSSLAAGLLAAARDGDMNAHAALYETFAPMVFTLARRMLASSSLAEDVLQETFVEVITRAASCRDAAAVGAWIHRIAVNKCLMQLRSAWWSRRLEPDNFDSLQTADGRALTEAEIELGQLLDRLPMPARAVVWLHDAEGYTHEEIAEIMGRTVSFSKSQLARARARLRAGTAADGRAEIGEEELTPLCTNAIKTL